MQRMWKGMLVVLLLITAKVYATPALGTLKMCVDHYPPLQMISEDGQVTGENVVVTQLLVSQLNFSLSFTEDIPFSRCLQWLKEGKVDIMSGLLSTEERRQFADLFLYKDMTVKQFFVHKNGPEINQFDDLTGLRIGVIRGVKHFQQFDDAKPDLFNKVELLSLESAFGMLAKGRLDAVLCTERHGKRVINQDPELKDVIIPSRYNENLQTQVYIALSKKSTFAQYVKSFEKAANKLYLDHQFQQVIDQFKRSNPQLYSTDSAELPIEDSSSIKR